MKLILANIVIISLALLQIVCAEDATDLQTSRYLAVTSSPTRKPTKVPTMTPTRKPTKDPTMKPTQKPTTPYKSTKIVSGDWVTGFEFLPGGEAVLMAERYTGMIHTYNMTSNTTAMIGKISGISAKPGSTDGLIGVAIDPNFATSPYIYVYASRHKKGKAVDQVIKLKWDASMKDMLGKQQIIWSLNRIKGAENQGGRIKFGPDGYLYVTVGDQDKASLSQDMKSDAGKILRLTNTGGVPESNPFTKSRVFAYGYRNSIGLTFDPKTGSIWSTDNGPACNDEVNLITAGSNYGWGPTAACPNTNQDGENIQLPKEMFNGSPRAITGLAFAWTSSDLYVGHLIPSGIRKLVLDEARTGVKTDGGVVYYLPEDQGLLLALEADSSGNLYYSTVTGVYKLVLKK